MKAHVGTDTQGHVHSVEVPMAATHDSVMMEACLHGEEEEIYGDTGYVSAERKATAEARGATWCVSRKAVRGRGLSESDRLLSRKSSRTRAHVEHPFGVVKHVWGTARPGIVVGSRTQPRCVRSLRWPMATGLASSWLVCEDGFRDGWLLPVR